MSPGVAAIRTSAALSTRGGGWLRARGEAAYDVLDRVLPCDLYLRDGQMRPTLLLDDRGEIVADVQVLADDLDYLVHVEGIAVDVAAAALAGHRRDGEDASFIVEDLVTLGLDGPFAWEVLSAWDTPGVVGLPYLTSYRPAPDVLVVRAGRTGEFGYDLVAAPARAEAVRAELTAIGAPFELGLATRADLARCALENFFFDATADLAPGVGPRELQLQWRLSRKKAFVGSDALARRPATRRVVAFRAPATVTGEVWLADSPVGAVLRCEATADGAIGYALVDLRLAHSGVRALSAGSGESRVGLHTVSPPFVANRSLYVKPQQHTWADRARIPFPP